MSKEEKKTTMNDDPYVQALSRVSKECLATLKTRDWSWLEHPKITGDAHLLLMFRRNLVASVNEMIEDNPTEPDVLTAILYHFYTRLWSDTDATAVAEKSAFRSWIYDLAGTLKWRHVCLHKAAAPIKNTPKTAVVVSSSDDEEEEEGDRAAYDSSSPVDLHDPSSPPPLRPSVSLGAAADDRMEDDEQVSVPVVHLPRRSPSQAEEDDALLAQQDAVLGVPVVVGYSDGGAAAAGSSEPQARPDPRLSPAEMKLMADDDAAAAATSPVPSTRGSKVRPQLAEPASRKAKSKRQKISVSRDDREVMNQATSPARSTRSSGMKRSRRLPTI